MAVLDWTNYREVFLASPETRIALIRQGVTPSDFKRFANDLGIQSDRLCHIFGISSMTIKRKAARHEMLSRDESAKVVGMATLVGQVQVMIEQSGNTADVAGFEAGKWLAHWMGEPVPALCCKAPAAYMDTIEGQNIISRLLAMMQTGAYV